MGRVSLAKELARRMGRGFLASSFSPVLGSLSPTQTSEPARRLQQNPVEKSGKVPLRLNGGKRL